jgi:putative CocE/NonD family hydrolase
MVFETGTNQWRRFDAWPPKQAKVKSLYLLDGGKLAFDASRSTQGAAFDEYVSDPAKPVPYIDGTAIGMTREYMVADQRASGRRTDVLVYRTEPLDEDVTLAGPINAALTVSTSGTDSDWVVKLIDVYPDDYPDPDPNPTGVRMGGFQQLVRGDVMRGKFRNGFERSDAFSPGEPTEVKFTLQDILHTFRAGHRIMVHVQSSWFPLVDRNPQSFVDIYRARESDFQKATQRIYHAPGRASRLDVEVLP